MKLIYFRVAAALAISSIPLKAEIGVSKYEVPEGLVEGASFRDLFLPVPTHGELRSDVWGADNVIPRDVDNGIEDEKFSYWGGNIIHGDDGREHLFVCRWPADDKRGHRMWWGSTVVHAVSNSPLGPFKVIEELGKGHNPEVYRLKDGSYNVGFIGGAYHAKSLEEPWENIETVWEYIGDPLNLTNKTYVVREDGSVLMMNKNGYVFISEKGDEHFKQVTKESVYPHIPGAKLEDPVIWKDEVQYHLVMNDWYGRVAFHLRSADGLSWKWDPGIAYDIDVMRHEDGTQEKWFKFERPKVRQDQFGRATHMNFAVIDVVKDQDKGSDNHSSKNIVVPLVVARRMEILNRESITADIGEIQVKIFAEEGFDPLKEVDTDSLTFGAPEEVDFGKGCRSNGSMPSGADLIVTFSCEGNGITNANFAAKMLGKDLNGKLLFGYAKLP